MPNKLPAFTPNPLTTVAQANYATSDKFAKAIVKVGSLTTAAGNSFQYTLPDASGTNLPALYYIVAQAASPANNASGFFTVHGTSALQVDGGNRLKATSTTANDITVSISSGALTVANATTNNATEARDVFIYRVL